MSVATVRVKKIPIEVEFTYSYDPGYPGLYEFDIISLHIGNVEVTNLLDYVDFDEDVYKALGKYISEMPYEKYQD